MRQIMSSDRRRRKTGPKPERLKLRGDWEGLVGKALAKPRPSKGWPKPKKKARR
jgi:hypothetical protein